MEKAPLIQYFVLMQCALSLNEINLLTWAYLLNTIERKSGLLGY